MDFTQPHIYCGRVLRGESLLVQARRCQLCWVAGWGKVLGRKHCNVEVTIKEKDEVIIIEQGRARRSLQTCSFRHSKPRLQIPSHRPLLLDPSVIHSFGVPIFAVRDAILSMDAVEVKLRLPDVAAHGRVVALLAPFRRETLRQENFFFDGCEHELSSQRVVLLFRFYDCRDHCVICFKAKGVLVDGISRVEGEEEEIDISLGRECVAEPEKLGSLDSRILKRCKDEFMAKGFVGLGGFVNVRDVFDWKGLKLEVDETKYDFGTCYEIECETSDPEGVRKLMEDFLKENGIEYRYSEASKFSVFRSGKLPY